MSTSTHICSSQTHALHVHAFIHLEAETRHIAYIEALEVARIQGNPPDMECAYGVCQLGQVSSGEGPIYI